jgi:multidrug transporter EmrE-like cation transporter
MLYASILALSIILNVAGNGLYKLASRYEGWTAIAITFGGMVVGAVTVILFSRSLVRLPLNVAFPVFSAVSIVAVAVAASVFFHEPLSRNQALGSVVILVGVGLMSLK